jgi:hypothetical protein
MIPVSIDSETQLVSITQTDHDSVQLKLKCSGDTIEKENNFETIVENGDVTRTDHNYVSKSETTRANAEDGLNPFQSKRKQLPKLEQLTIEIPTTVSSGDDEKRMTTRSSARCSSLLNSPQSKASPREDVCTPSPCSTSSNKSSSKQAGVNKRTKLKGTGRTRTTSGDSNASLNSTSSVEDKKPGTKRNWSPAVEELEPKLPPIDQPGTRPSKRRCSENAAELIKACMGVDDHHVTKKACTLTPNSANVVNSQETKKVEPVTKKLAVIKKVKGPNDAPQRAIKKATEDKVVGTVKSVTARGSRLANPKSEDDGLLRFVL